MNPITVAQMIPERIRQAIYAVLPTLVALELLFDLIPAGVETKIVGVLVILGFGTAFANTPRFLPPPPAPPAPPVEFP